MSRPAELGGEEHLQVAGALGWTRQFAKTAVQGRDDVTDREALTLYSSARPMKLESSSGSAKGAGSYRHAIMRI
ncbi:hypothetical protein [Nocardia sp. NPDC047648]|uniref:hypothetical protein n=1 Tax=Nocardia sp. NPDC047648 TaxID=3155625 RepID=UPI0033CCE1DE